MDMFLIVLIVLNIANIHFRQLIQFLNVYVLTVLPEEPANQEECFHPGPN